MAAATDLSVKKADGTTSITWTLKAASGGDRSPAIWRSDTATGTAGQRPQFSFMCRPSGDGKSRRFEGKITFPSVYTDTSSSLTQVRSTAVLNLAGVLPLDITDTDAAEFAAQAVNLLSTSLIKTSIGTAFAPT